MRALKALFGSVITIGENKNNENTLDTAEKCELIQVNIILI